MQPMARFKTWMATPALGKINPLRLINALLPEEAFAPDAKQEMFQARVFVGFCVIMVILLLPIAVKDGVALGLSSKEALTTLGIISVLVFSLALFRVFRSASTAFYVLLVGGFGLYFFDLWNTGHLFSQAMIWGPVFVFSVAYFRGRNLALVGGGVCQAVVWGGWFLVSMGVALPASEFAAQEVTFAATIEPSLAFAAGTLLGFFVRQARDKLVGDLERGSVALHMASDALQASQTLLKTVLEAVPHGIAVKDPDGRILHVNRAFAASWEREPEAMMGLEASALVSGHPEETELIVRTDREVAEGGAELELTMIRTRPDGSTRHLHVFKTPFLDARNKTVGIVEVDVDITDRVKAEQRARILERMQAIIQVIGGVCHTFNNINQIILGNLDRLQRSGDSTSRKPAKSIEDAIRRATTVNTQLLTYARQRVPLVKVEVDLAEVVGGVLKKRQVKTSDSTQVKHNTRAGLGRISINREELEKVVGYLLANAEEAIVAGGKIEIHTSKLEIKKGDAGPFAKAKPGDYVSLSRSDTGVGMSPGVARKAFEPFFTTKDFANRSGLGLSNVFGIVKEANGEVHIDTKLGRGTTVQILFPRA